MSSTVPTRRPAARHRATADPAPLLSPKTQARQATIRSFSAEEESIQKKKIEVYFNIKGGQATWDDAQAIENEWAGFEARRRIACDEAERRAGREEARQNRVRLNERIRKFVGCYLPPVEIRHMPLSVQAVYLAISKCCCRTGSAELANGQIEGITGLSKASVKRATTQLVSLGLIVKTIRKLGRLNLPNVYAFARRDLLAFARKIFGRGRLTDEPQLKSGFNPVPTQPRTMTNLKPGSTPEHRRSFAWQSNCPSLGDSREELEALEQLTELALHEIGKPLSSNAGQAAITRAVDRIRQDRIPEFRLDEWCRFRKVHGRKADLALLETCLLEDIREGRISSDKPRNQQVPIRNPARYLHGILANPRHKCRPHVTLAKLLAARNRPIPGAIADMFQSSTTTVCRHE